MKLLALAMLLVIPLATASCAHTLEQIVEEHHEARVNASMSNQPLRHGAGDGIGSRNAHGDFTSSSSTPATENGRLTLAAPGSETPEPDVSKNR